MPSPSGYTPVLTFTPSTTREIAALHGEGTAPVRLDTSQPISFSFSSALSSWSLAASSHATGVKPLNASQQEAFRLALAQWSAVANIAFTEVDDSANSVGDIRIGLSSSSTFSSSGLVAVSAEPQNTPYGGDIWISSSYANADFSTKSANFAVLVREIGHVLGLSYPSEGAVTLAAGEDNQQYTVMSYTSNYPQRSPTSPMVYDIRAAQYIYGANMTTRTGDDVYLISEKLPDVKTLWDAGGSDTISALGFTQSVQIDLREGQYSSIGLSNNVGIAYGVTIEAAIGGAASDVITGNAANNTLTGGAGDDTINGGAGTDTAVYSGRYSANALARNSTGFTVSAPDIGEGTDQLIDVERVRFADKSFALDVSGNGGQAYRLYQAAFNREPDKPGLGYQMNALDIGLGIVQVAQNFINSPEFSTTYGNLNDNQFVTQLYANVLHREPDAGGLAFHLNNLAGGMSRAQTLVGFSESPENQAALIGVIQNGMEYVPVA